MKYLFVLLFLFNPVLSYSGPCVHPEDRDSAGRRCGKRASSIRPGGELGGDGTYNRPSNKTQKKRKTTKSQKRVKRQSPRQGAKRYVSSIGGGMGIEQNSQLKSVLAVFKDNKEKWFTVSEIRDRLKKDWPVAGLVDRLSKKGELIKSPDGKRFKYCRFLIVFQ